MNREKFFGESYVKGFRRTEALLRGRGAKPDVAQELAQAAWAKTWQCLLQLRDDRRILQFVNTIAIRLFLDEVARNRRLTELIPAVSDVRIPPAADLRRIDLRNALRKCPACQRTLLETVYLRNEDRSTAEIAAALRITEEALHHRLSRARRTLRKIMSTAGRDV
jgi:RNA polymerase sigma factor (sigma-70 family)